MSISFVTGQSEKNEKLGLLENGSFPSSAKQATSKIEVENKTDGVFTAVTNVDEYVDDILDNLSASHFKQISVTLALKEIARES